MSASWPTTIASDSTLFIAVNELQNNLSGAINNSVTTIGLNSTTGYPTVGLVLIDNEVIKYGGISGNNLTSCTRAYDGTTAAAHSSGAVVSFAFCAAHHNNLKDEVIAIETSLNLTASRAISSDTNGRLAVATTTLAELNFLSGVTSAVQTQLNLKAPLAGPTFSGTITTPLTASRALTTGASNELAVSATTATELGYVSGVTSAIQTQINAISQKYFQTITATGTSSTSVTAGTFTNTVVTASITPSSSSHRVKITVSFVASIPTAAGGAQFTLNAAGSDIIGAPGMWAQTNTGSSAGNFPNSFAYIHSPATTSAVVYMLRAINSNAAGTVTIGNGYPWSIILEEIA